MLERERHFRFGPYDKGHIVKDTAKRDALVDHNGTNTSLIHKSGGRRSVDVRRGQLNADFFDRDEGLGRHRPVPKVVR